MTDLADLLSKAHETPWELSTPVVPLAVLPPEPMLWCPTCLGRYLTALGCADAVLREVAA